MQEKMRSAVTTLTSAGFPNIKNIQDYLESGDPKALARVKKVNQQNRGWLHYLVGSIGDLPKWTDADRRMIHVLVALDCVQELGGLMGWFPGALGREKADEDCSAALYAELDSQQVPKQVIDSLMVAVPGLTRGGKPNSAGRYVLALSDAELLQAFDHSQWNNLAKLFELIVLHAPNRVETLLHGMLKKTPPNYRYASPTPDEVPPPDPYLSAVLLEKGGDRFEPLVVKAFDAVGLTGLDKCHVPMSNWKFWIGAALCKHNAAKYLPNTLPVAARCLRDENHYHEAIGNWLIKNGGKNAVDVLVEYVCRSESDESKRYRLAYTSWKLVNSAAQALGADSVPILQAAIERGSKEVGLAALAHLVKFNDSHAHDTLIMQSITRWLDDNTVWIRLGQWGGSAGEVLRGLLEKNQQLLEIATKVNVEPFADRFWPMLSDKQATLRISAARALAGLGDAALPRAAELVQASKADVRKAAVALVGAVDTDAAVKLLEDRLDAEADEDVRDTILLRLDAAWSARGKKFTREDIETRIARSAERSEEAAVDWLDEKKLPALHYVKDGKLDRAAVRYLLYRQGRVKEIRMDAEARPLYDLIDRARSGDFAIAVLQHFLASKMEAKDRWALTVAGLLGDARVVSPLVTQVRKWVDTSRGQMAEYAVNALALLTCDEALLALDALALRYRSKYKNVGQAALDAFAAAAERLGVSVDELGDRVVPWLGFEPGKPRLVGKTGIEARIGPAFKLQYYDPAKKKVLSALPKSAPADALAEFKEVAASLREISKSQVQRLENLLVRQHRWPINRWQELFRGHPLLVPFSIRLVWGIYDADGSLQTTFRALEDGTLTAADDEAASLPKWGSVGMIHPLELTEETLSAWRTHLADHEIEPPFAQLERPVVRYEPEDAGRRIHIGINGNTVNGLTFKGRVDRLGWVRGSVVDNGTVPAYVKRFASAGIDAVLRVQNMYMGIDANSEVELQDACFARAGSVRVGGYSWDYPEKEDDERALPFREVPAVVFSEVLGDLQKIAGKSAADSE